MPIIKTCPICGKEFKITPSKAKLGRGKFCSIQCKSIFYKEKYAILHSKKIKRFCVVCGNEFEIKATEIERGRGKYCSRECFLKARHAFLPHYKYLMNVLHCMKLRCYNPKIKSYKDYGGRGIKICPEWLENKMNFYNWAMANGYEDGLTIERIDVNGNYEPSNCHWITKAEQAKNRRCNIMICLTEICRIFNLPYNTINARINRSKWNIKKALTTPIK